MYGASPPLAVVVTEPVLSEALPPVTDSDDGVSEAESTVTQSIDTFTVTVATWP